MRVDGSKNDFDHLKIEDSNLKLSTKKTSNSSFSVLILALLV